MDEHPEGVYHELTFTDGIHWPLREYVKAASNRKYLKCLLEEAKRDLHYSRNNEDDESLRLKYELRVGGLEFLDEMSADGQLG